MRTQKKETAKERIFSQLPILQNIYYDYVFFFFCFTLDNQAGRSTHLQPRGKDDLSSENLTRPS